MDGASENGGKTEVEGEIMVFESLAGAVCFIDAVFRKINVCPASETIFKIPKALAVAK